MAERSLPEESIFAKALEIESAEDRRAFLDQHCGDNHALRAEVEALLLANQQSGDLLDLPEEPSVSPTLAQPLPILSGTEIGHYKLLQQIGEGGMGVVFMAEQTQPVHRKVALKIIKPGMDSRQVIARFEAERQALAMMDHVNIARVIDGGTIPPTRGQESGDRGQDWANTSRTPDPYELTPGIGRPYFVMELIHGVPITKYCDDNHLTPRERLELFIPVCQAIQHAHQKGIIHRDIKPSNVLVTLYDGKPVPKVIDFGVAKAIDQKLSEHTLFTNFGTMVGTLEYMSPEQAEMSGLGVDTRSDIYSLGVLLYELLTGSTPLTRKRIKEAANLEILRIIKEEEPPKPSTRLSESGDALASISAHRHMEPAKLTKLVRGELDWIVMKTLEKDRNRRYETANGLAVELQRYLADEPVQACPPSNWYRVRKFVRRNKVPVIAGSLVLLALVGGIIGTSWGLIEAEEQREIAEKAEAETLEAFRASTDDAIMHLIGSKKSLSQEEKTYLEKTLERWKSFAERNGNDKRSRAIRAEGLHRIGLLWSNLGRKDEARVNYEMARDLRKQLATEFPDDVEIAKALAKSHNNLASVLKDLGRNDDARAEFISARDIRKRLVEQFPNSSEDLNGLASVHYSFAGLLNTIGRHQDAVKECIAARDIQKKLVEQFPAVQEYQSGLAGTLTNLAIALDRLGNHEQAGTEFRMAQETYERLVKQFPDVPNYRRLLAISHHNLGHQFALIGKTEKSLPEYMSARDLRLKLVEQFPMISDYSRELAGSHMMIGDALFNLRKRDDARVEYQFAKDLLIKLVSQSPTVPQYARDLARTQYNLGNLLRVLGDVEESRMEYNASINLYQKLCQQFPAVQDYQSGLANSRNNFGLLLSALGKIDEAHAEYQAALRLQKKLCEQFPVVPQYVIDLGGTYSNLGMLFCKQGKYAESLSWFDQAIQTLNTANDKEPHRDLRYLRISFYNRALTYERLQKFSEALKDRDRAVELSPIAEQITYRAGRAVTLIRSGQVDKAFEEIAELTKNPIDSIDDLNRVARFYAVASSVIASNKQEYADRAMEFLSKAVQLGFKDVTGITSEPELDSLRERDDFKKLIASMEKKTPPHPKK